MSEKLDITNTIDLVRDAQGGDRDSLNRLIGRYYDRVHRIVRLRLGARLRRHADSMDMVQETFASAITAFDRFEVRDEASFINWLARIAERRILAASEHFGAKKRSAGTEIPIRTHGSTDGFGVNPAATGLTPSMDVSKAEQITMVEACIQELPDEYRELIILRDYVGASWEDVARETGRPTADAARKKHGQAMLELNKLVKRRSSGC